ncbi:unnamed protein product, partial [Musa textilis]
MEDRQLRWWRNTTPLFLEPMHPQESSYGNFKLILHPTMLSLMPEVEHLKLQIDFMLHQLRKQFRGWQSLPQELWLLGRHPSLHVIIQFD